VFPQIKQLAFSVLENATDFAPWFALQSNTIENAPKMPHGPQSQFPQLREDRPWEVGTHFLLLPPGSEQALVQ
jgi:hypothetical protein